MAQEVLDVIARAVVTDEAGVFSVLDTRRLRGTMTALGNRLPYDLDDRIALVVPANKVDFYEHGGARFGHQFGDDVADKFKSKGKQEIGEAANCLALGRDTACVFHLMRAIEVALNAVDACLRVPKPQPRKHTDMTWGAILKRLGSELDNRENLGFERQWNDMSESGDKLIFRRIHASLDAIRRGYRDPTMHVESTYTEREASYIYSK